MSTACLAFEKKTNVKSMLSAEKQNEVKKSLLYNNVY